MLSKKIIEKKNLTLKSGVLSILIFLILIAVGPQFSACVEEYPEIGNFVWKDLDGDGYWDVGEPGIDGVTVEVYKCDDTFVASTTTIFGWYRFNNKYGGLTEGSYYVKFILPSGYKFTLQDQGTYDGRDSDADPLTGKTICTYLEEDESDPTWDAGLVPVSMVSDLVAGGGNPKSAIDDVGDVSVWNDGTTLYVEYETIGDWVILETHLAVENDLVNIPQTKNNNPKVGHFEYKKEFDPGVNNYAIEIDLWEKGFEVNDDLYIAAHAVVYNSVLDKEETAWGDTQGIPFNEKNWAMYFIYIVQ